MHSIDFEIRNTEKIAIVGRNGCGKTTLLKLISGEVDMDKLDAKVATPAFINVNDGTNEGLSYTGKNIFTVQFHPEACPGPQDSGYLFDRFITMMRRERNA